MPTFVSGDVQIAYDDSAAPGSPEPPIVLVHGFASNRAEGWRRTGWYGAFERRGRRVVGLDLRGHGESGKPHDPKAYGPHLAGDVIALLDELGLRQVDLFGYSMGARTALQAAIAAPDRISNLILGGVGARVLEPSDGDVAERMAAAMTVDDPDQIEDPLLRSFRYFADEQGEDRMALAACVRARHAPVDAAAIAALPMPALVLAGQRDTLAGDPDDLARLFPHGQGVAIVGCDHFSAIPHALAKAAVFDFLDGLFDLPLEARF